MPGPVPSRLRSPVSTTVWLSSISAKSLERRADRLPLREHRLIEIAVALDPAEDHFHGEAPRVELLGHLFPAERSRDRRSFPRPNRIDRRDRLPLPVLVRVDQDSAPLLLRPLRGHESSVSGSEGARDDLDKLAGVCVGVPSVDLNEDMDPVGATRLRESLQL